jgi:hypothetical protein
MSYREAALTLVDTREVTSVDRVLESEPAAAMQMAITSRTNIPM